MKIMASSPIASWQIDGEKMETVRDFNLLHSKITADSDCRCKIKGRLLLGRKVMRNLGSVLKSRVITLATKVCSQSYAFYSSHVRMWGLDHKEDWAPKNWCFWAVVLEKILESPLDYQEIQPVHPKGNWFWIFIGRTDAEAEVPIFWLPDVKSQLSGKGLGVGKGWRKEEKGATEDDVVRWHHRLSGHESEQTQEDSEG